MANFFGLGAARKSIEQSLAFAEQAFASIEAQLGDALASYQIFEYHNKGFWHPVDYEAVKKNVLDSHVIRLDEQRHHSDIGRRVAFLIDEEAQALYLNITHRDVDPQSLNWEQIKLFEAWAESETDVDRAIEAHRQRQRMERQGKPAPRWWQFWLIK